MLFVYTTFRNHEAAQKAAHALVERKLAVGVNTWPISAHFGSAGECKETEGTAALVRTFETKLPEVENLIAEFSPGGVPMVAAFAVWRINRLYKEWLMKQGFE